MAVTAAAFLRLLTPRTGYTPGCIALMAVTAAAFQAVRAEGYTPVVWLAACLLLVFSWLGGFTIGLLYAPSAFLMLFAAVTMRED